jgi:hypothetical protein
MNFRFNIGKATESGCLFLERAGGRMNIMKLVKLMYLTDEMGHGPTGIASSHRPNGVSWNMIPPLPIWQ